MLGFSSKQRHYPTHWDDFCGLIQKGIGATTIGFALAGDEVSRFAARYRVAKAFRGIDLNGYSKDTIKGYNSLMRVFLTWSAFERFVRVIGLTQITIEPLLAPYRPADCLAALRKDNIGKTFYDFVEPRVNQEHKTHLLAFANGTLTNPTFLASSVRHLFAHGHLTAHAGGSSPEHIDRVCEILVYFHMSAMDGEFTRIVAAYKQAANL